MYIVTILNIYIMYTIELGKHSVPIAIKERDRMLTLTLYLSKE